MGAVMSSLNCDIIGQIKLFLDNELNFELGRALRQRPIYGYAIESKKGDDFYYTFLEPTPRLLEFEEGTWVKVEQGKHSQYGSIWFTEEGMPYLITGDPLSLGSVKIIEANAVQLLTMQKEGFSVLLNQCSVTAHKIYNLILGRHPSTDTPPIHAKFFDERIYRNKSQALAVTRALAACDSNSFFLIHGPPGTGKTTVITEIVRHLVNGGRKVLVTSHTNVAVDNVMENLFKYYRHSMVRLGPKAKVSKPLKELVPTTEHELIRLRLSSIVGATLSKLSILVLNNKLSFSVPYFDVVIIDESSMATIPLTLCGLLLGKTFILVGDHKQLPPITRTPLPPTCPFFESCGFCESLFRLLIELYPRNCQLLDVQFRSHPSIMNFPSKYIYGGKIRSSEECYTKKLHLKTVENEQVKGVINDKPLCYLDMNYDRYDEYPVEWFPSGSELRLKRRPPSCFNELEAAMALKIRHDLIRAGVSPEKIWIITPFRLQREILRKSIKGIYGKHSSDTVISIYEDLTASTVDSIQGKENDIIIYSLTWVPRYGKEKKVHAALSDIRRLNVALTRAQRKLIIIGDLVRLSWKYPYGPLKDYMKQNDAIIEAPLLTENDPFLIVVRFYYQKKKNRTVDPLLEREVRLAKRNIRGEIKFSDDNIRIWKIESETDFQNFTEDYLWSDLTIESKKKIYDLMFRGLSFEIYERYEKETEKRAVYIKTKINGEKFLQYT